MFWNGLPRLDILSTKPPNRIDGVAVNIPPYLELVAGSLAERPSRAPVGRIRRKGLLISAARNRIVGVYFGHRGEEKMMFERNDKNGCVAVTRGVLLRIDGGEPYSLGYGFHHSRMRTSAPLLHPYCIQRRQWESRGELERKGVGEEITFLKIWGLAMDAVNL